VKNPLELWGSKGLSEVPHLLAELKQAEKLHDLLAQTTDSQQNAFFEATEQFPDETNFLGSIREAWRLVELDYVSVADDQSSRNIGYQVRYALIAASLNSYTRNLSPRMLIALVEKQVWSIQRGYLYARSRFQDSQRKEALCRLGQYLDGKQLIDAIKICWNEEAADWAAKELNQVPELCLPLFQRAFRIAWKRLSQYGEQYWLEFHWMVAQALEEKQNLISDTQLEDSIRLISSQKFYDEKLAILLITRFASAGYVGKALEYADHFYYFPVHVHAVVSLLPFVSVSERKSLLRKLIRRIDGYYSLQSQVEFWTLLFPHLSDEFDQAADSYSHLPDEYDQTTNSYFQVTLPLRQAAIQQTLVRAHEIAEPSERATALAQMLGSVSDTDRPPLIREIFGLLQQDQDKTFTHVAQLIVPMIDDSWWDQTFEFINLLKNNSRRYEFIVEFIDRFPKEKLIAIIDLFPTFDDKWQRGFLFVKLLPRLIAEKIFNIEGIDVIAFLNEHDLEKSQAFPALAPFLSEKSQAQVLQHAYVDFTRGVEEDNSSLKFETQRLLETLAPKLPESLVREALDAFTPPFDPLNFRLFEFSDMRDVLIPELARFGAYEEVFASMRSHQASTERVIPKLAQYIPPNAFGELLSFVKTIDNSRRESMLDKIIDLMPPEFLLDALGIDAGINDESQRIQVLMGFARALFLTQCTSTATRIMEQIPKSRNLVGFWEELIRRAPDASKQTMKEYAVQSISEIDHASSRFDALIRLAPFLTEDQKLSFLPDIISYARTHSEFEIIITKVKHLVDFAQLLPDKQKETLLDLALRVAKKEEQSSPAEKPEEKLKRLSKEQIQNISLPLSAWSGNITGDFFQSWFVAWATADGERGLNGIFGLLSWIPEEIRFGMLLKCYEAGWEIPDATQRAEWFVRLFRLYPQPYATDALVEALAAVRLVSDIAKQSECLDQLMRCFAWEDSEHAKINAELSRLSLKRQSFAQQHPNIDVDDLVQKLQSSGEIGVSHSRFRNLVRRWVKFRHIPFLQVEPAPLVEFKSHNYRLSMLMDDPFIPIEAMLYIAPALPLEQRNALLDQILVQNRNWPNYDKQGKTLLEVAILKPDGERLSLIQEAFTKLRQQTKITYAEPILYRLMEHLSPEERPIVLPELIQFAISSEWSQYLNEEQSREYLNRCASSSISYLLNSGIAAFSVRLAELGFLGESLGYFSKYQIEDDAKSWGLGRLIALAGLEHCNQILGLVRSLGNEYSERDKTLKSLAIRMAELGEFSTALKITLEQIPPESNERLETLIHIATLIAQSGQPQDALRVIQENIGKDNPAYAKGLCRLIGYFPEHTNLTLDAFYQAYCLSDTNILDELISPLFELPPEQLYMVWQDFLHSAETRTRAEFMSALESMTLVALHLGWEDAISEIANSIQDVGRWWP